MPDNQLPAPLRAQIISISLWVGRHTSAVIRGDEEFEPLIDINRIIMQGLHGSEAA
jgi:flagellar protein FlaF